LKIPFEWGFLSTKTYTHLTEKTMNATNCPIDENSDLSWRLTTPPPSDSESPTSSRKFKTDKIQHRRMSIALPEKIAELLENLAALQDITQAEALRRAILSESFLQKELLDGSDILIRKRDGSLERVLFR
jgi:hypothetical protein